MCVCGGGGLLVAIFLETVFDKKFSPSIQAISPYSILYICFNRFLDV